MAETAAAKLMHKFSELSVMVGLHANNIKLLNTNQLTNMRVPCVIKYVAIQLHF